jgi:outer membrane protein
LCTVFLVSIAQARDLSLSECLRIGEENNLGIVADRHHKEADSERVQEAKSGNIPSVNAAIEYGTSHLSPSPTKAWIEQGNISTRLTVPLFEGFRTKHEVAAATSARTATELEGLASRLKLRRQISLAFYKIEIGQRELELSKHIVVRQREQKQLMELRFNAGQEPRWAVTQAESEIAESLVDSEEISSGIESNREDLRQLLNLPPASALTIAGSVILKPSQVPEDLTSVIQGLPEIQAAATRIEQQRAQLRIEESGRWPKISAFASWQRELPEVERGSAAVGIEASLRLFDPGRLSRKKTIQASIAAAELDLADLHSRSIVNLRRAIREYRLALKKVEISRLSMAAARERAKIISEEYAAGFRQYLEWEQTERQLVQFEKGAYATEINAAIARVELEFISAGKIL